MHNSAYLERPDPTLCRVKGYARLPKVLGGRDGERVKLFEFIRGKCGRGQESHTQVILQWQSLFRTTGMPFDLNLAANLIGVLDSVITLLSS